MNIEPYAEHHRQAILDLSARAWAPVFPLTRAAVPRFRLRVLLPHGWETRQIADLAALLDHEPENADVALEGATVVGWVCTRLHPEARMGEVYVLAVDPDYQRRGIGSALMRHSLARVRAAGMTMVMVETGDDPGTRQPAPATSRQASSAGPSRATSSSSTDGCPNQHSARHPNRSAACCPAAGRRERLPEAVPIALPF